MKIHTTVSLDETYFAEAKKRGFNLSGVLNDCLGNVLGGKKAKTKDEDRLQMIIKIAEQLELPKDEVLKISETLDRGTAGLWQHFKSQFEPDYDMWKFIELRKMVKELLIKSNGEKK